MEFRNVTCITPLPELSHKVLAYSVFCGRKLLKLVLVPLNCSDNITSLSLHTHEIKLGARFLMETMLQ